MKYSSFFYTRFRLLLAALLLVTGLIAQDIPARPNPPRLVNDFASVLTPDQRALLEQKLVALDDSTSNQIAVVTIPTLGDNAIEDYANKLFRSWGIGDKKHNNGILVLVAVQDHRIWIEIGYGLEGAIPDVTTSDIINQRITPYFKQGNYYMGLDKGVDALGKAAAGEYHIARDRDDSDGGTGLFILILVIVILVIMVSKRGGGSGGGGFMSRRGYGNWIPPIWLGSGGAGSSGGWGGSSGGGFGGFGGGSSGGGGAGGSW